MILLVSKAVKDEIEKLRLTSNAPKSLDGVRVEESPFLPYTKDGEEVGAMLVDDDRLMCFDLITPDTITSKVDSLSL